MTASTTNGHVNASANSSAKANLKIPPAPRPLRADARRNYARLLHAARETFDEQGSHACLDEIARRAGVGIGTLYRHFPTRREMLEAVLHDGMAELHAYGERLLASPAPGEALALWLRAVVANATATRGLSAELLSTLNETGCRPSPQCEQVRTLGARLLARAQTAGEVRDDLSAEDLFMLVHGIAWAAEQRDDAGGQADRLLTLMLDGVRRA